MDIYLTKAQALHRLKTNNKTFNILISQKILIPYFHCQLILNDYWLDAVDPADQDFNFHGYLSPAVVNLNEIFAAKAPRQFYIKYVVIKAPRTTSKALPPNISNNRQDFHWPRFYPISERSANWDADLGLAFDIHDCLFLQSEIDMALRPKIAK